MPPWWAVANGGAMAGWGGIGEGAQGVALGVAAAIAVVVGGAFVWQAVQGDVAAPEGAVVAVSGAGVPVASELAALPAPAAEPAPAPVAPVVEPVASPEVADTPPAAEPPAPEPPAVAAPVLDLWRMDAGGAVQVAGRAEPLSRLSVMIDADEVVQVPVSARGEFVADFVLPPGGGARLMTLVMLLEDGRSLPAVDPVLLMPPAPAQPDVPAQGTAPAVATAAPDIPATGLEDKLAPEAPASDAAVVVPPVAAAPLEATVAEPAPEPLPELAMPALQAETLAPVADSAPPPAALQIGAKGVRVLTPAAPASPAALPQVTIDAISYDPAGQVVLGGRGMPGMVVRLYLDTALLAEMAVRADGGWGGVLPDIQPGRYTLRADQIDATGKTTARFETPFQRETVEALAAATLAVPAAVPDIVAPVIPATGAPALTAALPAPVVPRAAALPAAALADAAPVAGSTAPTPALPAPLPATAPAASAPAIPLAPVAAAGTAPAAPAAPGVAAATAAVSAPVSVTVQPGFTLWAIAQGQYGDGVLYVQVFDANRDRIRDPDLIYPGQILTLPQTR